LDKRLTALDVRIIQALHELGPRNLSKVAEFVGVSRRKLMSRIRFMQSDPRFFLRICACIYHTNIGLKRAVVVSRAVPGMEQLLFDCLLVNDFWLYCCRSYGQGEGCTAVYAIPVECCREFEEFVYEIKRLGVAGDVRIFWSTCFQVGRVTSRWFDNDDEWWIFRWDDWVKDVQAQKTDLPYTLVEVKSYSNYADDIDVQMLMHLEADATKSIKEIAEILGISRQLAQHHYKNHLIGKNLIEGYDIFVMRYGDVPSVMVLFIIYFSGYDEFAKFANFLLDKFFVLTMGKVLGENALLVEVFLPFAEFRRFVDFLSVLARMKFVRSYEYFVQDLRIKRRQTISGEFFRDGRWVYEHKKYMARLWQKVSQFMLEFG
jgi:DNA-binding Lrp family transcriptional regulator